MIELALDATPLRIGEIFCERRDDGTFALCHRDDCARDDLVESADANDATEIARFDDGGAYRPLKTAPNLRHGWKLLLMQAADVRLALELFYPGRLAALAAFKNERLITTSFRDTLARQTGMYRVAAKISDAQADILIAKFCRSDGGCLRTILWRRDASGTIASTQLPPTKFDPAFDQTGRGEAALPLLCQEACNLLVAEARKVVKAQ
ncbi:MAG TPA: DR2241 family protein [Chthoniobacterales bacterium]